MFLCSAHWHQHWLSLPLFSFFSFPRQLFSHTVPFYHLRGKCSVQSMSESSFSVSVSFHARISATDIYIWSLSSVSSCQSSPVSMLTRWPGGDSFHFFLLRPLGTPRRPTTTTPAASESSSRSTTRKVALSGGEKHICLCYTCTEMR